MESSLKKIKIAILGATGATGKEIVRYARNHEHVDELTLIVQRTLEEWKQEAFKCKLNVIEMPDYEDLSPLKERLQDYDVFMSTLGSRVKVGAVEYRRVEVQYPMNFARLGREIGVPEFYIVSSTGSNSKSWLLLPKVKGEIEEAL